MTFWILFFLLTPVFWCICYRLGQKHRDIEEAKFQVLRDEMIKPCEHKFESVGSFKAADGMGTFTVRYCCSLCGKIQDRNFL